MRLRIAALAAVAVLAGAGCGSSSSNSSTGSGGASGAAASSAKQLTVSAAASLKTAFTAYGAQFSAAKVRYSFAGSDVLAAQIEQGLHPDVFASANTQLPKALYAKGLVSKPVVFAANRLVLAVPAGSHIHSLADAEASGVAIAIGSPTVPIGIYTRKVLKRLGPEAAKIQANVRSEEPDVSGIVGKLTEGAVQAGFVYVTDVDATHGKLVAVPLPASLQPTVAYGVAVVKGASNPTAAQQFIQGLLNGDGRTQLAQSGFLPPPAT
jgi:molybdate transport system substrate-binding protein